VSKRILLVHRYFWPDVPTYAQMLRFIAGHLESQGHTVSVFCGPPTYNAIYDGPARSRSETIDGVHVHRVALPPDDKRRPLVRALSLLIFAVRLVAHVIRRRSEYDLITVTTIPPVVMGTAARLIKRLTGIPYVYHCMDLYPEVAEYSGMARSKLLVRAARRLDSSNCRAAEVVVVLSPDMCATLSRRGLATTNVAIINNFDVGDDDPGSSVPRVIPDDDRFRVLFAGNMGRFQGLDRLVEAAQRLASDRPDVEFVFMGAGVCLPHLKAQAGELVGKAVRFVEHQPVDAAARAMEDCELAVVSLRARIHEVAYPSKIAMYLASGCRILAVVETDSDLARFIRSEDLGTTCPPGDVDALVAAIHAEVQSGPPTESQREAAKAVGDKFFSRQRRLDDWTKLVADLGEASD
jgi:colanic acid biosynthesis glycosyl transferase WcaI